MPQKILLVNDDLQFMDIFGQQLSRWFHLVTAQGADIGLEKLREDSEIDVIVANLNMHSVDGIDFLIQAKAISPWTVGILISGRPTIDQIIKAVNRANIFGIYTTGDPIALLFSRISQGLKAVSRSKSKIKETPPCLSREELIFFQTVNISSSKNDQKI
ncbi:response regulator [Desulfonatronovibrio magnus]|uniref:response regulator n=1 Tax=Desulfonatronovibrio magnus TaxID=698827 RepID=UPI0005EBA33B|nr:response regulator [Desulfonatronovibrio magnus]